MAHKKHKKKKHKVLYLSSGILIFIFVATVIAMTWHHNSSIKEAGNKLDETESEGPMVNVTKVQLTPGQETLTLTGEARPMVESTIYAKLSGYLRAIYVDKGDHVKAGQILGKIESPETDQAFFAARSDEANKTRIAQRMKILEKQELISAQEAEQAFANADIAQAQLRTQKVLKGYEELRAPFDGLVTARYVDPGDLIQNGSNSQASSLAIVTVSQTEALRIYIYVDQRDAPVIKVGQAAKIHVNERPDKIYLGTVKRVTDELDPKTRMLLTEIDYDNSNHDFVAGSFVSVELTVEKPRMLQVPVSALVFRNEKTYLAVVGKDSKIHLQEVTIVNDDGIMASLSGQVEPNSAVVLALGPNIKDNAKVQIAPDDDKKDVGKSGDQAGVSDSDSEKVALAKSKKGK